ncbi:MAG: ferric reductase-like transmembrane domain-containing protein [Alphaproteobacteria bacterium]|nr:ferric reductase-like transmembrane domain-containing protein [Alphaproteobacteria bacterium]
MTTPPTAPPAGPILPRARALPPAALFALVLAVALAPLGLVLAAAEPPNRFWPEFAVASGLVALALLLAQFLLSGRIEALSGRLGIDRTMRIHREAGRFLVLLALIHPLAFVAPTLATDPLGAAARLARMATSPAMASGVAAWLALLFVALVALFRRRLGLSWESWRAMHALGAALAAMLGTHHALRLGGYSGQLPALGTFWLALMAVALAALGWTWLVKPALMRRDGWRMEHARRLAPGFWEVTLARPGAPLRFAAGQFAWIAFGRRAPWADNPFSIASAPERERQVPGEARLAFVIREAGDMTCAIGDLAPGTPVQVDAPHGAFTLQGRAGDAILLVAGGAGIAPILSLLRDLDARGEARPIRLAYGVRLAERLLYREEMAAIAARRDFRAILRVEEDAPPALGAWAEAAPGLLDRATLAAALAGLDPARTLAFVCGPTPMMLALAATLEELGLPWRNIVYERFDYD